MKIAIAGYGVEGKSNYAYWAQDSANELTIVDEKLDPSSVDIPEDANILTGEGVFQKLDGFDIVVRTAGLAPRKIKTNGKIWSSTNEFFVQCPAPIIGITGSKGKGTTSSLIASVLEAAGKKVWLVGNIGIAPLGVLDQIQPEDIVVFELSSFQLWDLQRSPKVAVVLLIEPDHLDVHTDMAEYIEAKAQITRHQTADDLLVFNEANEHSSWIAKSSAARKIGYPSDEAAHIVDGMFYYGEQPICSTEELRIPGEHNRSNALAAIDAVWPFTQNTQAFKDGFNNFKGLLHRLSYVATVHDVAYYDDSIATTPGSAIAALRAFTNKRKVIILGGSYKGSDFTELSNELTRHDATALLIGDEADRIAESLNSAGFNNYEIITSPTNGSTIMQKIVHKASEIAQPGDVVLLSPSAASFGLFKNYADRGEQFIAAVTAL